MTVNNTLRVFTNLGPSLNIYMGSHYSIAIHCQSPGCWVRSTEMSLRCLSALFQTIKPPVYSNVNCAAAWTSNGRWPALYLRCTTVHAALQCWGGQLPAAGSSSWPDARSTPTVRSSDTQPLWPGQCPNPRFLQCGRDTSEMLKWSGTLLFTPKRFHLGFTSLHFCDIALFILSKCCCY